VRTTSGRTTRKEINFNINTWNVITLQSAARLENLTLEMDKCELSVVCLSEVQWPGKGKILSGNYTVLRNDIVECVTNVECYSDILTLVKISIKPFDNVIVQVYMPTMDSDDYEIHKMYDEIS
jgi:hypothetical protein